MSDIFKDFDKKNEVPKVKIPKFATGGICNDAIFPKLDAFSRIDEIVKYITKKKDNAIAMEFTKCIGELLKNNGVVPKIKQYGCDFYGENSFQSKFGVIIDELDFSEHDKVFEDKIAKLENQIRIYESKIQTLRTRCMESARDNFDKEIYGCLSIVSYPKEIENENKELKQHIADLDKENLRLTESVLRKETKIHELESKETEKPTKINLNDRVKVKLAI